MFVYMATYFGFVSSCHQYRNITTATYLQDRQCKYNVTLRRVCTTMVSVEKQ